MKRRYKLLRAQFLEALAEAPSASKVEVAGDEAGLHMILKLRTACSDEAVAAEIQASGVPAACLSRYYFPGTGAGEGSAVVLKYAELSQGDFPRVLLLLRRLTAGENLEKAAEK